ncbi:unnamed protein product [Adineta steineri]|uniref:Uncharacterized protein n=1 Tax=Adineta steineri TaxID=433720 RepID=A0A816E4Z8_9BILA|nr:unnamed protein product [Adineta steineri]CAF1184741.1 unnamed protein product [Adineta steineri]CAF1224683.1 unnamed protein product [Adineta steineri]CAF1642193.1 unnamed protein product [Adineta steineri]
MRPAGPSRSAAAWPLAAICCLGLLLFTIAAAIVIALIPVYLPTKNASASQNVLTSNTPFYLQTTSDADDDSNLAGTGTNTDDIANSLGISGDDIKVTGITTAPGGSVVRRKRGFNSRTKRSFSILILITCQFTKAFKDCNAHCMNARKQFQANVLKITSLPIKLAVNPGSAGLGTAGTYGYTCKKFTFLTTKPSGFPGPPPSNTFTCIKSGLFTDASIWDNGIVPYGACNVVIPAGFHVVLATPGIGIRMISLVVYGTLSLGSGSSTFKFNFGINLVCRDGGKIEDLTTNKQFLLPFGSVVTIYPNGGFVAAGTTLQSYTSTGSLAKSVTISSTTGPFTCGILPDGTTLTYNQVMFFVIKSGDIGTGSCYLGGSAPTGPACASSGCGIYVAPSCTLTTASLSGQLSINIGTIIVNSGSTCDLGTGGSSSQFKCINPISIIVRSGGTLQVSATSKTLLLPLGSMVTIYKGGSCTAGTVIQSYTSSGLGGTIQVPNAGPFTGAFLSDGTVLQYNEVTFIAINSGDIQSGSCYMGGFAPNVADCSSGCGIYIAKGVTLSTASLNGVLNIDIDTFTVAFGATLQIGTPGSTAGFKFLFPVILDISGTFSFVAAGGGIFLVVGSEFNLLAGGSFISAVATFLQVYDPVSGALIGVALALVSGQTGPWFVTVLAGGGFTISIIGAGLTGVSSTVPVPTVAMG